MSDKVIATAWELEKHRDASNEHKFYRIIQVGRYIVVHWGRVKTAGQVKVTERASDDEARAYALKQFYAKRDRGYDTFIADDMTFEFNTHLTNYSPRSPYAQSELEIAYDKARREAPYTEGARKVSGVYEQFIERAYGMLNTVSEADLNELLAMQETGEYGAMMDAFGEITRRHEEAEAAMSMVRTMVEAKLTQ